MSTRPVQDAVFSEPLRPEQPAFSVYPWELDTDRTLVECANRAQSKLRATFAPEDREILVEHDPSRPEPWGSCGWVEVGGNVYYYGGTRSVRVAEPVRRTLTGRSLGDSYPIELHGGGEAVQPDSFLPSDASSPRVRRLMGGLPASVVGIVEFARASSAFVVRGKGSNGGGAQFVFEDSSLFEPDLAYWQPETGALFLSPVMRGGVVSVVEWFEEPGECETPVGVVPPSTRVVALTKIRKTSNPALALEKTAVGGTLADVLIARAPIVAEHHNSLASAVASLERVVGVDGSDDPDSLDKRLGDLESVLDECEDVPEVYVFSRLLSMDSVNTTVSMTVVASDGVGLSLDFGDGTVVDGNSLEPTSVGGGLSSRTSVHCYKSGTLVEPSVVAESGNVRVAVSIAGLPPANVVSGSAVPTIDGIRVETVSGPLSDDDLIDQVPVSPLPMVGSDLSGVEFSAFKFGTVETVEPSITVEDFVGAIQKLSEGLSAAIAASQKNAPVSVAQNFGKPEDAPCFAIIPCESSGPS